MKSMTEPCCSLFGYLGKNPGAWWLSSLRLKEASDVLHETCWPGNHKRDDLNAATADFRLGPVYMLLMGMALEAGLKAILVAENPKLIEEQRISKTITTHKLKALWRQAGLSTYRTYDSLLDRIERFVVAFGRYPVPRTRRGTEKMAGMSFHGDPDFDAVTRLWVSLEKQMKKAIPELLQKQEHAKGHNVSHQHRSAE